MKKEYSNPAELPVLIICFNRTQYIQQQIEAIRKVRPTKIYIFCDGAREDVQSELEKVTKVRSEYLSLIDWPCEIKTNFSEKNLGCSLGPISAMRWFFNFEKEGIILEDDIIPHPVFFKFCAELLPKYRYNNKIISISGCNLGFRGEANSYLFSPIMNMWGWATWADRFNAIDFSMIAWTKKATPYCFLYSRLKTHLFDFDLNWWHYWKIRFDKTIRSEKITWWDYQFIFHQLNNRQKTIFPSQNLIRNLGFEEDATHTSQKENPASRISLGNMAFPLKAPKKMNSHRFFYSNYLKPIWALYTRPNWKYYIGKLLRKK